MNTVIKNEKQYKKAVARMDEIFHAKKGSIEGDELEFLLLLTGDYEERHFPIPDPDPIEAIKFRMEQMGINRTQLSEMTGQDKSRISQFMSKRRKLSLEMIKMLHKKLSIPAEVLIS